MSRGLTQLQVSGDHFKFFYNDGLESAGSVPCSEATPHAILRAKSLPVPVKRTLCRNRVAMAVTELLAGWSAICGLTLYHHVDLTLGHHLHLAYNISTSRTSPPYDVYTTSISLGLPHFHMTEALYYIPIYLHRPLSRKRHCHRE